ncbi:MAG TPA: hypothetical protein PLG34_03900 [Spirochaetota bacterium]|jgi:hypothetical protein|nr:MAG: hypothetical protein BWX91_00815 [Spirochaetes bacterium ADurb.Bin133]HNZ27241.1 hypothetical protein [Spirochaetota bacterium]HPY87106.1 hypothetical protein [Spirochaetota bacterium]HQB60710.1 hypothetical protein [Spirochaetota bacterium]
MKKEKYVTTIYLDREIEAKLKYLCKEQNRNINNLIGYLILKNYQEIINNNSKNGWDKDTLDLKGFYDDKNVREIAYE